MAYRPDWQLNPKSLATQRAHALLSPPSHAWREGTFFPLHPSQNKAQIAFTPVHTPLCSQFNSIILNSGTHTKNATDTVRRKVVLTYWDHFCSWWTRTVPTVCSNAVLLTKQAFSCFSYNSSKSQTDGFAGQLVTQICLVSSNRNCNPAPKSTLSFIRLLSTDPQDPPLIPTDEQHKTE